MPLTQEKAEEILHRLMEKAKANKEALGYHASFPQAIVVIGPQMQIATLPGKWRTPQEKADRMQAVAAAARSEGALAVYLINDCCYAPMEKVNNYYGFPKDLSWQEWERRWLEVKGDKFMHEMPRAIWEEALLVTVKGPALTPRTVTAKYRESVADMICWMGEPEYDSPELQTHCLILPDWWDVNVKVH